MTSPPPRSRRPAFIVLFALSCAVASAGCAAESAESADANGDEVVDDSDEAIVNGTQLSQSAYAKSAPWTVALNGAGNTFREGQWCGGTRIAQAWVLTAAHCVWGDKTPDLPEEIVVGVGRSDKTEYPRKPDGKLTFAVKSVAIHPAYDRQTTDYDFALLELSVPEGVPSASTLPLFKGTLRAGDHARVYGWGLTSSNADGTYPNRLRAAPLEVAAGHACDVEYGAANFTSRMICADGDGLGAGGSTTDACYNDSGGPFVVKTKTGHKLAGLVSFGPHRCAVRGKPAVYARVSSVAAWITATTHAAL